MDQRPNESSQSELSTLNQSHISNEVGRDTFVGLGHTALFATSVSFVSDVASIGQAVFIIFLIMGWFAHVCGLLALTYSFHAARCAIDQRRNSLYEDDVKCNRAIDVSNFIALWTFPIGLLCLSAFVVANVVHINDTKTISSAEQRDSRSSATSARP